LSEKENRYRVRDARKHAAKPITVRAQPVGYLKWSEALSSFPQTRPAVRLQQPANLPKTQQKVAPALSIWVGQRHNSRPFFAKVLPGVSK
jgi:hypothetical protein